MITFNQTPLTSDKIIFVVKLTLNEGSIYRFNISTYGDIILQGNNYRALIDLDGVAGYSKQVDISGGGDIGSNGNMEFIISKFAGLFIEELYPVTDKMIYGAYVEFGVIWYGADREDDITWINDMYVNEAPGDSKSRSLFCLEYADHEDIYVPNLEIQNSFNDGHSFYPNAKEDMLGTPLPIVYGRLFSFDPAQETYNLCPTVQADANQHIYVLSMNKCFNTNIFLYKYLEGVDTYMSLTPSNGSYQNNFAGRVITMRGNQSTVFGELLIPLRSPGQNSQVSQITLPDEISPNDFTTLNSSNQRVASFVINGELTTGEVGQLGQEQFDIDFITSWTSTDATNRTVMSCITRNNFGENTGDSFFKTIHTNVQETLQHYPFANITTYELPNIIRSKEDDSLPWSIEELQKLEYKVMNQTANGSVRLRNAYLKLSNINVNNLAVRQKGDRKRGGR